MDLAASDEFVKTLLSTYISEPAGTMVAGSLESSCSPGVESIPESISPSEERSIEQ